LPAGIYRYNPERHELKRIIEGDKRQELQQAAHDQEAVGTAPVVFVITAVAERTAAIAPAVISQRKQAMPTKISCCKPRLTWRAYLSAHLTISALPK